MNEVDDLKMWKKAARACRRHLMKLCGEDTNSGFEIHSREQALIWMRFAEIMYVGKIRVWYDRYWDFERKEVRGQQLITDFMDWLYPKGE